ncbi:MAG TPA: M36 family metallopeptidase, partial [Rubricoccaceae bacterium]
MTRSLVVCLFLAGAQAHAQTLQARSAQVQTAVRYAEEQAAALGFARTDAANPIVTDAYVDAGTGVAHVYLRQQVGGVEVADANLNVTVGRDGRVAYATGAFRAGASAQAARARGTAALSADEAVQAAAAHVGAPAPAGLTPDLSRSGDVRGTVFAPGAFSLDPVTARLVYQPVEGPAGTPGALRLAWETMFAPLDGDHYWVVRVDAQTGAELARFDLVDHDTWGALAEASPESAGPWRVGGEAPLAAAFPAEEMAGSYKVYAMPVESPSHAGSTTADLRTTVANSDNAIASPFGWHDTDGAAGPEYTITRGNNAYAYTDTDSNDTPDAGSSPDGGASLTFAPTLDLTLAPSANRPASVVNLFYWTNVLHDVMYQYGFTEPAGSFQTNAYGRGGAGNDAALVEAQDGSGTDNANFVTPPDGWPGRMQMYTWTGGTPNRDSDFDAGIIAHEYGHGVSNRLTGGPSAVGCLTNSEAMSEGWSDYIGLMLTMRPGDTRATNRGLGTYLRFQPTTGVGNRPGPYTATDANPYTYQDTRTGSTGVAPHGVGFVWATALWRMTWDLIDAHGFSPNIYDAAGTAGNQIALRLVTEAMKLQPCSPGFVDGRDAILAADNLLYGGVHRVTLWASFANRGLGYGATQGSTTLNSDNTEAFGLPPAAPAASVPATPISVVSQPGPTVARTVTVANTAAAGAQSLAYSARLTLTGASSPQGSDAFGHAYRTSADAGGPAHVWASIATSGTAVTFTGGGDQGSAAVALPFPFPFYGENVTSVRVHTNGFLTTGATATTTYGHSFPSPAAPNGVISPFWYDLDGAAGNVRTLHDAANGRFIVQYTNVRLYGEPSTSYTFQVVLYVTGRIEYVYNAMTPSASASAGIENGTGTDGLTVTTPITANSTVRIEPSWLSLTTATTGTLAAGASASITV